MSTTPKFVLSAGMVGSASTFIFNVARELLIYELPVPAPFSLYSDDWNPRFLAPRSLIVKCHGGSPSMLAAAEKGLVRPLLTIRHPGDSVCSDMERFDLSFAEAVARVETSLAFALSLSRLETCTVFRYEDGFASDPATPATVARCLDIKANDRILSAIYTKYDAAATRRLSEGVDQEPDSFSNPDNGDVWSKRTQIHRRHIGSMLSGRWMELPRLERTIIADRCGSAARTLGYGFED